MKSSNPVFIPESPSGGGVTNFLFSGSPAITPGTTYYFEIVVQSGDTWRVVANANSYGTAYFQGAPQPFNTLWFREGVIVPEPSAAWLVLAVGAVRFYVRRKTH